MLPNIEGGMIIENKIQSISFPFCFSVTVRGEIIFDFPFDKEKYKGRLIGAPHLDKFY